MIHLFQQFFSGSPQEKKRLICDVETHFLIIYIKRKRYYVKECIKC